MASPVDDGDAPPRDAVASPPLLFERDAVLAPDLCDLLCALATTGTSQPVEVQPAGGADFVVEQDVRRAWEVDVTDEVHDALVDLVNGLRPELAAWCGQPLEPCDAVAVLHYPPGAFYRTHRDVNDDAVDPAIARRVVSVVLFANSAGESFAGGTLRLFPSGEDESLPPLDIVPRAGRLVAFPSALLHEVTPVDHGDRVAVVAWLQAAST
ncbi:MAG: 2OG-Fe(II) oxygenase [Acidobacteria bacterium]|nr:2OG-Fe(II) oxygenase [Acidobacteriota bacterium]